MVEGGLEPCQAEGCSGRSVGDQDSPHPPPPVCLESEAFCWKAERDRNEDIELRA